MDAIRKLNEIGALTPGTAAMEFLAYGIAIQPSVVTIILTLYLIAFKAITND